MVDMEVLLRAPAGSTVLNALVNRERRRILDVLRDRDAPVGEPALAASLASDDDEPERVRVGAGLDGAGRESGRDGGSGGTTSEEKRREARVALHHVHLPALADAGLVAWDRAAATVAPAEDPPVDDAVLGRVVGVDAEGWGDVLACLADERRCTVLAVLATADDALASSDIARDVAARELSGGASFERVESVLVSLRHVHLPTLHEAGLVAWDRDEETVAYLGHPELDVEWAAVEPTGGPSPANVQ